MVPLLIAAGGGGNAYLEDPETSQDQIPLEQYENSTNTLSTSGQTGAAGSLLSSTNVVHCHEKIPHECLVFF